MAQRSSARDTVVFEDATCAFCHGKGMDPFDVMSALSTCCVCGGTGKVRSPSPAVACAHCQGTGAIKTLTCTTCGGKGSVSRPVLPPRPCPVCHGTGDDASAPAMACLKCRGRGYIIEGEVK
jgi:DnaJ-class molecular chaperone